MDALDVRYLFANSNFPELKYSFQIREMSEPITDRRYSSKQSVT
jgi:hypothetical protein